MRFNAAGLFSGRNYQMKKLTPICYEKSFETKRNKNNFFLFLVEVCPTTQHIQCLCEDIIIIKNVSCQLIGIVGSA